MSFLHPEFLYLMLPPVLVLFYFILTQKDPVASVFEPEVFARLQVREKRLSLRQRNAIYLVVFILLITAMAQPVITEATAKVQAPIPEVTAAVDISASMQAGDSYPSRLAVAKAKLLRLIDAARRERIGVLAFGKDVYVVSPPTTDKGALRELAAHFAPDGYAEKGTDILALLKAFANIGEKEAMRNLLLLTDGGEKRDTDALIAFAKENRIRLYILGIGTPEGGTFLSEGRTVKAGRNPDLARMAEATGGAYADAVTGSADIAALLRSLRRHSEGGETGVREIRRYGQLYILPLGAALVLLLIATSSLSGRRRMEVPTLLLAAMLFGTQGARAELFDYELLDKANGYYQDEKYLRAANAYFRYGKLNGDDPQAMYDSAHALYRAGNNEAAAALWKQIRTKDRLLQFAVLHNLGNAYANMGGEAHLNAALKAYKSALYLENDPQTRENMEIVQGRLIALMRQKREEGASASHKKNETEKNQPEASPPVSAGNATPAAGSGVRADTAAELKAAPVQSAAPGMSDFEAAMWLKRLQSRDETRLYRITPPGAGRNGGSDASPW